MLGLVEERAFVVHRNDPGFSNFKISREGIGRLNHRKIIPSATHPVKDLVLG